MTPDEVENVKRAQELAFRLTMRSQLEQVRREIERVRNDLELIPIGDDRPQGASLASGDLMAGGGGSASQSNDHSWRFVPTTPTGATGGTVTLGQVFLGGTAKTVTSFPGGGTLSGVTTTTHYWVAIDRSAATATWGSGASVPANTDTVEYWHVLTLTCAGSVITGIVQRECSDIRVTLFA